MSDTFTPEQLEALRDGTAPKSGSLKSTWSTAPRISKTQKVTGPASIRASKDGELIQLKPVAGPSPQSIAAGQAKEEAERKARAKSEAERLAAIDETQPDKVQARLAFLEREVRKLTKQVKELSQ